MLKAHTQERQKQEALYLLAQCRLSIQRLASSKAFRVEKDRCDYHRCPFFSGHACTVIQASLNGTQTVFSKLRDAMLSLQGWLPTLQGTSHSTLGREEPVFNACSAGIQTHWNRFPTSRLPTTILNSARTEFCAGHFYNSDLWSGNFCQKATEVGWTNVASVSPRSEEARRVRLQIHMHAAMCLAFGA